MPAGADLPDDARILALNAASEVETSRLDPGLVRWFAQNACYAAGDPEGMSVLFAFDQEAAYTSPNFLWFREREPRFVYVDRIIVAAEARGRGLARRHYETLFAWARSAGFAVVVCEVNIEPPNPASWAFHEAMGFEMVGEARGPAKRVGYLRRAL